MTKTFDTPEGKMVAVIDSSGWQYNYRGSGRLHPSAEFPVFKKAAENGVAGIYHRIGNGTQLDWSFNRTYVAAKADGLKIGAYYYAQPGRMSAESAADHTNAWLKPYELDLPVMLDLEEYYGDALSKYALTDWVKAYLEGVSVPGRHPAIMYAGAAFANEQTIGKIDADTIQPRYYRNNAVPPVHPGSWSSWINWNRQPRESPSLGDWEGWQFTSSGDAPSYGFPRDAATDRLDLNFVRAEAWESWLEGADAIHPSFPNDDWVPILPNYVAPTTVRKGITPVRLLDEREDGKGPRVTHKVQTPYPGGEGMMAEVSVAVVPDGSLAGFCSDRIGTSFLNYGPTWPANVVVTLPILEGGVLVFGSSNPVHAVVDIRAVHGPAS